MMEDCQREPNMEIASTWWSELPAKWTPFGWKDHMFRYNVLFNGMISAVPDLNPRAEAWKGLGCQLGVVPLNRVDFPGHVTDPQDNGSVIQGWYDSPAPVLWTEWAADGITFREEVFGHVPGGKAVETGIEPLFAWVRLTIHDLMPGLPLPEKYGWSLNLRAPYIATGAMSIRYNIAILRDRADYPRKLTSEPAEYDPTTGLRLVEPDGKIRLGIAPGHNGEVIVLPDKPGEKDFLIHIPVEVKKGNHVDLLLPMIPTERDVFDREMAVGYDRALAEANSFWAKVPKTAARFETPEEQINKAIVNNLKMGEIIAEKDPETGEYAQLTGSWAYADIWATPAAMQSVMVYDTMGYFETAEKYLEMYIDAQGTVLPQGDYFEPHPGSLGPPERVAATVWTSDHGALLWAIAEHGLVSGNAEYIERVTEPIVKGCEFIQYMRGIDGHDGVVGLIPPGVATDMPTKIQSVWADAWNHKGLATAVRFLKRIDHPRAGEFEKEAEDYRRVFVKALREAAAGMPTWTDDEGEEHHLVPMAVHNAQDFEYRNAFYLDTGPLVAVFAGLVDADDPMMTATIDWFRNGPPREVYRYDSDCWQVPSLHREMSSCEPCYSFNVFHSHELKDRKHYLEGMYSLFAGAISRQTHTACETRGGVTGVIGSHLPVYLARLAVLDDQVAENELHLLRLVPLAWLMDEPGLILEKMPTEFGPVDLRARLDDSGKDLDVDFNPSFRVSPGKVILHVPPLEGLERILLNGKQRDWSAGTGWIVLE
jgi:hypothetical protein